MKNKKGLYKGVPVREYKKIKNILMGTPASALTKRVRTFPNPLCFNNFLRFDISFLGKMFF